ncbi:MAG: hypothetical protein ACLFSI_07260 [Halorhodospira sp.]
MLAPAGTQAVLTSAQIAALLEAKQGSAPVGTTANQGQIRIFAEHDPPLVIKTPRPGPGYWLSRWSIRREHRIYQRLADVPGIPYCYGLFNEAWLVLAYIPGTKVRFRYVRSRHPDHPTPAVAGLRTTIAAMHRRGVAHTDLKRHDNLIFTPEERLVVVDFGAAMLRSPGKRGTPLWRWAAQQDWNAWARYGWGRDPSRMPPAVARLHRRTALEQIARTLRPLRPG